MQSTSVVVGVFDDRLAAEKALDELHEAGFPHSDLGFALRGSDAARGGMITDAVGTKDSSGAIEGATTGALAGGILGAIAALVIPGIGPVVAAGALATALGFAGAGAAVGGILGAMTGLGVSQDEALYYEDQFNAGKAIVTVRAGEFVEKAVFIIRKHGGITRHQLSGGVADTPNIQPQM